MPLNVTGCELCKPDVFVRTGPRESEGHAAVRFNDHADRQTSTFLNGEPISDVFEMVAGPGGWAIRLAVVPPPFHLCPCGASRPELVLDHDDGYEIRIVRRPHRRSV